MAPQFLAPAKTSGQFCVRHGTKYWPGLRHETRSWLTDIEPKTSLDLDIGLDTKLWSRPVSCGQ